MSLMDRIKAKAKADNPLRLDNLDGTSGIEVTDLAVYETVLEQWAAR